MGEVRVIAFQQFVDLFDQEGVVFVRMGFEDGQFYLFDPVLIEDCENLIDVGFTDEALDNSEAFVCNYLLVDGFPYLFLLFIALLVEVYSFEVELD